MHGVGPSAFVAMLLLWGVGFCSLAFIRPDVSAETCIYQPSAETGRSHSGAWYAYQDRLGKHTVIVRQTTARVQANC